MIRYIKNEQHYNLLLEQIAKVKHTLWIGTADLKDLYVKKGNKTVPFCKMKGDYNKKNIPFSHYQLIHLQINTLVTTLLVTSLLLIRLLLIRLLLIFTTLILS